MSNAKQKFKENGKNMEAYEGYLNDTEAASKPRNQQRKFNNNKRPTKMKPVTYTLVAEDSEEIAESPLSRMINTLCDVSGDIKQFIDNTTENYENLDITNFDDMVFGFLCQFTDHHAPQLEKKINIHSSINVTSNKVHIRIEGGIGFGIEARYTIVNRKATITSIIGSVTLYEPNDAIVESLEERGFEQVIRQSRR
jgi:hypothetical protein